MSLNNAKMNAWDAVSGSMAECIITIEGKKYNFMQLIDFEATIEKTKKEIPILGRTVKGHKTTAWEGKFKGKAHYNQSVLRKLLSKYNAKALDTYFEIMITNEDDTGKGYVHKQTVILKDCNLNGGVLTKFDVNADFLEEDIEGTFDNFEINPGFSQISGMVITN